MARRIAIPRYSLFASAVFLACLMLLGGCGRQSIPDATVIRQQPRMQQSPVNGKAAAILRTARALMGTRYRWGGDSPRQGFDCSGFIWFVYRQHGIILPRVSWQQFGTGRAVSYSAMRPGDLIFHKVDKGAKSMHVGIVTDRGTFIHSPSSGKRVMESSLNNTYWRQHYVGVRRVL